VNGAKKVADIGDMTRDEWLQSRRAGIGASEAAAIVNQSPWSTPWQVWLDKTGQIPVGGEETEAMYFGNLLESTIGRAFAERTGMEVSTVNATYAHPEHDWMLASPDRFIHLDDSEDIGLLEIKNSGGYKLDEWQSGEPDADGIWRGGEAPLHYILQVQHQHAVMGTKVGYIGALLGGNRLCIVEVPRDQEMINMLIAAEQRFWNEHVLTNSPPPIDGQQTTAELLMQMYAESDADKQVELDDRVAAALLQYQEASDRESQAKEAKTLAANILRDTLGDAESGTYGGVQVVTWKPQVTERFDQAAFKQEHPDLYVKFLSKSSGRVLRPGRSKAAQEVLSTITGGK
jgi:putative phage-type endonuclease